MVEISLSYGPLVNDKYRTCGLWFAKTHSTTTSGSSSASNETSLVQEGESAGKSIAARNRKCFICLIDRLLDECKLLFFMGGDKPDSAENISLSSFLPPIKTKKELPIRSSLRELCFCGMLLALLNCSLCGSKPSDRNPERRAGDVVDSDAVEELDGIGISTVLTADTALKTRPV